MKISISRMRWAILALGALLVARRGAAAQQGGADARWDAYLGCWQPVGAPDGARTSLLCIVPGADASAADLVTVTDGRETAREHLDATGRHVANVRDGCKGWESGDWSADGERLYLHADFTCANGARQRSTALLALDANGDLLDVQGLESGKNTGVRVARYREATDPGPLPPDVANAVGARTMAVDAARVAAAAPLTTDNVIEASSHLNKLVVEAWLANRGDRMAVNGHELETLARGGVPGDVIDVMVALAYPDKFAVNPAVGGEGGAYGGAVAAAPLKGVVGADTARARPCVYSAYAWGYDSCGYDGWAYGYGAYGPSPWGYNPLWYGAYGPAYGYGYGYGYGGYGYGGWYGQPVVVVVKNGGTGSHGRVIKGRGYVSGQPATGNSGARIPAEPSGSASVGGASGNSGSASGSSGSASGGRTAHRRGGGGTR